ncbi:MAG: DNA methyltransferase [Phycisphaerales bacterium]
MTETQKKLMNKLAEMFQFDQADLDFGIYRIMNYKRDEIEDFLKNKLMPQITEQLQALSGAGLAAAQAELAKLENTLKEVGVLYESSSQYVELKAKAEAADLSAIEDDVYSHLTNFFSRYYDDGDFISQRRYKEGVYAIPYEGEEVKLHWANADQYYVKTSEYFRNFRFKTRYGHTVHFKLIEAETEKDNNKEQKKRLFQLYRENPFSLEAGELIIRFEYKDGVKKQDDYIAEVTAEFSRAAAQYADFADLLTGKDEKTGKSILEKQLRTYTARNTFDYFIHKDLGRFLNRELDFYIKTEVIFLDDMDEQNDGKMKEYITKAKVIRNIAKKIIAFLAQLEDFQKKLWLKKKFVVETNYCITLDRIPQELYGEVLANDKQLNEWKLLYHIEEIEGDLLQPGYTEPLTIEFLQQNPYLVVDTVHFTALFKERLIDSIENLDDSLDGLLIHSENFQALNLLQERYREQVKCVYIDPPYNTDSTPILYKNGYRDSSWVSLMNDRLKISRCLLNESGVVAIAIDDTEHAHLMELVKQEYPDCRISNVTVVHNPKGSITKDFNRVHEYTIFITKEFVKNCIKRTLEVNDTPRKMRRWGEHSLRIERPLSFYPIYIRDGKITRIGGVPDEKFHPTGRNIVCGDEIAIYPIDQDGVERRWNFGLDTIKDNLERVIIQKVEDTYDLFVTHELTVPKTVWTGGEFDAGNYGNTLLINMLTEKNFDYPKSINAVKKCVYLATVSNASNVVLDYFAGSGTTGHAVINLNREDGGNRKYILVEMGEYFDTVTKPRIQKVIYSKDWKDGKPVSRQGSSHAFKYLRLESYEDTLNNIEVKTTGLDFSNPAVKEQYLLQYMLPKETEGSLSLLNLDKLEHPFRYTLNITKNFASENKAMDLVETFNYLIGLKVEKNRRLQSYDSDFTRSEHGRLDAELRSGTTYAIKQIAGRTLAGDKVLILWRDLTGEKEKDNAVLDAYFLREKGRAGDFGFDKIYVNGDNNLLNLKPENETWKVLLIDEEMKQRLFEV